MCVRSVCECEGCELIGLELEAASVARFSLPAPSHTHTHTYIHFRQAAGGGEGQVRLSKSQQPIRAWDRLAPHTKCTLRCHTLLSYLPGQLSLSVYLSGS